MREQESQLMHSFDVCLWMGRLGVEGRGEEEEARRALKLQSRFDIAPI